MSAAPSHAPEHHPEAAPKAAPQANNTMHFNHGGVLGITESIGRLIKGVTYDAAQETWGTGAAANNDKHHKPEDKAHGADHPKADHPEDGKGHGAATAISTAAGAAHALISAHDEDKDIGDKVIDGIAKMGKYGSVFPLMASGLKWTKEKLFPTIHEIPTDDQHIGDQILHKLKKDKKAAKKGKLALDHHALEGFAKGLDVANIKRALKMFTNKDRFEKALKLGSGREEIKKEIANILDISGTADREEVVEVIKMLKDFLHIHGHLHNGAWDIDTKHIDERVKKQFLALAEIILNADLFLTQANLDTIYGTEVKEDEYDMDYKHIGDRVLKLKDKTLIIFLKRLKKDGIDDVENEVGDLLKKDTIDAELKHNPEDLKKQISNLFNVETGVTVAKLKERKDQMLKRLKYMEVEIEDPASTTTPKGKIKVTKVNSGDATLDAIGTQFVVEILEPASTLLTDDVLKKLYPLAEDAEASFKWTDESYKNFGATIFDGVNAKNRKNVLEGLDVAKILRTFNLLYSPNLSKLMKAPEGRKKLRNQLKALLKLDEPFELADVQREIADVITILTPQAVGGVAPTQSAKETENLKKLSDTLGLLTQAPVAAAAGVAGVDAGPFSTNESVEALFADVTPASPEDFVNNFRDLEEKSEVAAHVRGYKSSAFRGTFPYLVSPTQLDELIKTGTPEELNLAKKQLVKFVGLNVARITPDMLDDALTDFGTALSKVSAADFPEPADLARFNTMNADLAAIKTCLDADRLEAIFDRDNPYKNFAIQAGKIKDATKMVNFLGNLDEFSLISNFKYMRSPMQIDSMDVMTATGKKEIAEAKKQLVSLLGVDKNIQPSEQEVKDRADRILNKITTGYTQAQLRKMSPDAHDAFESMKKTLETVKTELTKTRLGKLYA